MIASAMLMLSHVWKAMLQRPSLFLLAMAVVLFAASQAVQLLARRLAKETVQRRGRIAVAKGEFS